MKKALYLVLLVLLLAAQLPAQGGSGVVVVRGMKAGNGDNLVDDANDALQVNCVTGCGGSGGTSMTDEAAFTEGTTNITPVGGTYNATADQVTDGDGAAAQITQYRAWHVNLRDDVGDSAMDGTNDALRVNVVAGSSGGASHVDDAVFTLASDDIAPTGGILDDVGPTACTEGNACVARITSDRQLHVAVQNNPVLGAGTNNIGDVDIASAIPAGTNNIGDVDVLTLPATAAEAAALPSVFAVVAGDDGTDTHPLQVNTVGDLKVTLDSEAVGLAAGTNNIGDVDIASALPAGTNNIGDVDVLTIAAGDNNIGNVDIASAIPTGSNTIGVVEEVPLNACTGNTIQNLQQADVATGAGTTLTTTTTCVTVVHVSNVTANPATIIVEDRAGTPFEFIEQTEIPGYSTATWALHGATFTSGITAIASVASALNIHVVGVQ